MKRTVYKNSSFLLFSQVQLKTTRYEQKERNRASKAH